MKLPLLILLALAMAATAYVLIRGVILMASGKDVTGQQSQQWMRKRVLYQAIAIAIIMLILGVASGAGH
ncbi:MAG: HIG1 domain-containing protein [Pseudomonadota bacterium]|nr:HIG1 domain-containing protein [Pseudomonadota bacterium]